MPDGPLEERRGDRPGDRPASPLGERRQQVEDKLVGGENVEVPAARGDHEGPAPGPALSSTAHDTGTSSWMPGGKGRPTSSRNSRRITLLHAVMVRLSRPGCAARVNVPGGAARSSAAPGLGLVTPPG